MKYTYQSWIYLIVAVSTCESMRSYTSVDYEYNDKHVGLTPDMGRMHIDRNLGVIKPTKNHTSTIIFLHAFGNLGIKAIKDFVYLENLFKSEGIKVMFPTAPLRPFTPLEGQPCKCTYVWYDTTELGCDGEELLQTYEQNYKDLEGLIMEEYEAGIPLDKILIGGFREGGTMAMHIAFRIVPEIRGVFIFDAFLMKNSIVMKELKENPHKKKPELLWIHSKTDKALKFAKNQASDLSAIGVKTEFMMQNSKKEIFNQEILRILWVWIKSKLTCIPIK